MINPLIQETLKSIWDTYKSQGKIVLDTKGRAIENIDESRLAAIEDIKKLIDSFLADKLSLPDFKTNLDSYNKQNNYWGFTAAKGQMFFNLIARSSEGNLEYFVSLLKKVISEPASLEDALNKIQILYDYALKFQQQASGKRYVANPLSSAYFLSYFWQIHNHIKWPVMYSSIILSFEKLGIWKQGTTAVENYKHFFDLNDEVKKILSFFNGESISNWDIEHALWNFAGTISVNSKQPKPKRKKIVETNSLVIIEAPVLQTGFELSDYIIPRIAKLIELGSGTEKNNSAKGRDFERMVGEAFKLLDFDVDALGQGSGREPDAIAKYPGGHIAFLIDAKAYSS